VTGIIRLLIADDHPVVRDGLRGIFEASGEFEVAGEAANGREAVDRAAALRPDVVLMDLRMPELDGVSAIRALAQRGIAARVLVLTTFDTDTDVLPAIEAGATGYLLIAHGCSNREAAARLFISEATVKTHVLHIYAKLGVNDRAAAVAAGFERGLLPRPLKLSTVRKPATGWGPSEAAWP